MRVTTWLLKERIGVDALVFLVESYLMGSDPYLLYSRTRPADEKGEQEQLWINVGIGGHAELIIDRISRHFDDCRDVVVGVCMSGDIEMIKTIHALGVRDFTAGLDAFICNYKKDATGHNIRVVELLFEFGEFGGFAMMYDDSQIIHAAKQGDIDMCRFLISKGFSSFYVWSHAGYRSDYDLLEFIVGRDHKSSRMLFVLHAACEYGKLEFIKHIAEKYNHIFAGMLDRAAVNSLVDSAITGDIYNDAEHDDFSAFTNDHSDVIEYLLTFNTAASDSLAKACNQGAAKSFAVLRNAGFKNCDCGLDVASHTPEYLNSHRLRNLEAVAKAWEQR